MRTQLIQEMNVLLEDCARCEQKYTARNVSPDLSCGGCRTYPKLRDVGRKLEKTKCTKRVDAILAKGGQMSKQDLEYLLDRKITMKRIQAALKIGNVNFYKMLRDYGLHEGRGKTPRHG